MPRRALLILAVLLLGWGGSAFAQPVLYRDAVRSAVQDLSTAEVVQWTGGSVRKNASLGRYVRWGGAIILGSALVYTALDYFYNVLKAQTGTPLDQWYFWSSPYVEVGGCIDRGSYREWVAVAYVNGQQVNTYTVVNYAKCDVPALQSFTQVWYEQHLVRNYPSVLQGVPTRYAPPPPGTCPSGWTCIAVVPELGRPSLPDWLQSNPDAADGVKQAVTRYLDSNPIGSPSAPYPGVRFEPTPNPNQWTDNPFTRPDLDTDGDGWPDSVEWHEANRRGVPWPDLINNPQVYPDPYADPDGDGYPNLEEVQQGTDPYSPHSHPVPRSPTNPRTDTDGDGYPDSQEVAEGTDPNDPASYPSSPPEQPPEEGTEPQWPGGPSPGRLQPVELPQVPELEKKDLPKLADWDQIAQAWREQVVERVSTRLKELRDIAAEKFPFGLVLRLGQSSVSTESAECAFPLQIGRATAQVDICSTPFWQAATAFRPVLLGMMLLTLTYTLVRRGLDVPA